MAHRVRVSLSGLAVLVLAPALHASADDLIEIDVPSLSIESGGNSFRSVGRDFLEQEGDFSGLVGQASYSAFLSYLGISDAIHLDVSNFGSDATLTIPSTGLLVAFGAASPADLADQIEDFVQNTGAKEWAKFLEEVNARSPLALLDGNPRATTALLSTGAFRRFGIDGSRARVGYEDRVVARFGGMQLRAEGGGGLSQVDGFSDLYNAEGGLTLAGHFGEHVGLSFALIGDYRSYQGAQMYDAGAELGLPITIRHPDERIPVYWAITPFVQSAAGASIDLASGGLFLGGGGVNSVAVELGMFEVTVANQLAYYGGLPIDNIQGYDFDTRLDQLIAKNGLKLGMHLGQFYLDAGSSFTGFLLSGAAVDFYATPFVGVGFSGFGRANLRLGYEADLGEDYVAHGGRVKLDFHF
jgi:hypothetical protein